MFRVEAAGFRALYLGFGVQIVDNHMEKQTDHEILKGLRIDLLVVCREWKPPLSV